MPMLSTVDRELELFVSANYGRQHWCFPSLLSTVDSCDSFVFLICREHWDYLSLLSTVDITGINRNHWYQLFLLSPVDSTGIMCLFHLIEI